MNFFFLFFFFFIQTTYMVALAVKSELWQHLRGELKHSCVYRNFHGISFKNSTIEVFENDQCIVCSQAKVAHCTIFFCSRNIGSVFSNVRLWWFFMIFMILVRCKQMVFEVIAAHDRLFLGYYFTNMRFKFPQYQFQKRRFIISSKSLNFAILKYEFFNQRSKSCSCGCTMNVWVVT